MYLISGKQRFCSSGVVPVLVNIYYFEAPGLPGIGENKVCGRVNSDVVLHLLHLLESSSGRVMTAFLSRQRQQRKKEQKGGWGA
jgi:hypothetical protein